MPCTDRLEAFCRPDCAALAVLAPLPQFGTAETASGRQRLSADGCDIERRALATGVCHWLVLFCAS